MLMVIKRWFDGKSAHPLLIVLFQRAPSGHKGNGSTGLDAGTREEWKRATGARVFCKCWAALVVA